MLKIKFSGIDRLYDDYSWRLTRLAKKSWRSGLVLTGRDIVDSTRAELEKNLAKHAKRKFAVVTQSCTDGLYFVLRANNIGKGSKVICPAMSFISTATAIKRTGADIIWADTDENGHIGNIDLLPKSDAIVYVNLFGNLANYEYLKSYCEKNKTLLIEDAAQSLGSSYKNIDSGRLGDHSVFSFSPTKNLPAFGNGGAVLTDSERIAEHVKSLRYHGAGKAHVPYGYNSVMSEDHCAQVNFLLSKYKKLQKKRQEVRDLYDKLLNKFSIYSIKTAQGTVSSNQKYVIKVNNRDKLREYLASKGIETQINYQTPMPHYPFFNSMDSFPNAEKLSREVITLPLYPHLKKAEVEYICEQIGKFYGL